MRGALTENQTGRIIISFISVFIINDMSALLPYFQNKCPVHVMTEIVEMGITA